MQSKFRRRPIFPDILSSIFGAGSLNFSVRNGKRCDPTAIITGILTTNNQQILKVQGTIKNTVKTEQKAKKNF